LIFQVSYFKEERESVSKANLRIGELLNWKINKLKDELSRNNANLDNDADTGTNVLAEIEQFEEKVNPILKLESNLNEEKQKYLDLTVRYEILEEEHVITKAKLVMEKETIEKLEYVVTRSVKIISCLFQSTFKHEIGIPRAGR
jgi:hypothetical protein